MAVTKVPYANTTAMGVALEDAAPAGGAVFSLQIKPGFPAVITFPPTVTVPSGLQGVQFDVTWAVAGVSILQAELTEYDGVPVTWTVPVFEADIEALAGEAAALAGVVPDIVTILESQVITMGVYLTREAPAPITVTLDSSDPSVGTVPVSVLINTGEQSATFAFTALSGGTTQIKASYGGIDKYADITVDPIVLQALAPAAIEDIMCSYIELVVVFNLPVGSDQTVVISSSDESVAKPRASSVVVAAGTQTAIVEVDLISFGDAIITATHATGTKQCSLTYGAASAPERPYIIVTELTPSGVVITP